MNKLSRSEVIEALGIDLNELKTKFKAKKIKSQKKRSIKSWLMLLNLCNAYYE